MKPLVFISTVTSELGTVRQLTANILQRLGYEPVWQDIFGTESGDLRQVLRHKIDGCEGLIQIVGRGYGAEPPQPDHDFGRISYTQFELLYARRRNKKTWILFAEDGCTRDRPLEQLDLPREPDHPDPAGYQAERRALQDAWRERLRQDTHLWHAASNNTELELKIERLKEELAALRRGFRRFQWLTLGLGTAAVVLLVCVLVVQRGSQNTLDEVKKGQTVTKGRIREHLVEVSEGVREEDQEKAKK
jgi:hypothetical protein